MRKFLVPLAVLAVLMLVTSLAEAQQRKNRAGGNRPGGAGPGGPGVPPGGGPGGPPPIGQILPPFLQDQLQLTPEQQQKVQALQSEVNEKLASILTEEQNRALQQMRQRGPGGFGPPPGGGEFGGAAGGGPGGPPGGGRQRSPIGAIMAKLGSPRGSLTQLIGQELKQSKPAWETIQSQTQEYAQQAADLAKYDPPRGSKQSWAKLTTAFASSAAALDKAAQAKDKKAAGAAQARLANSCMNCHREHRAMGPGGRGPGGFGPGGPGAFDSGGPPPGGF